MTAHTAPPYRTGGGGKLIAKDGDDEFTIAFVRASPWGDNEHDAMQANAAYIALACNAHDALVALFAAADAAYGYLPPSAGQPRGMLFGALTDARAALA